MALLLLFLRFFPPGSCFHPFTCPLAKVKSMSPLLCLELKLSPLA